MLGERPDPLVASGGEAQQRKLLAIAVTTTGPSSFLAGQGSARSGRLLTLPSPPDLPVCIFSTCCFFSPKTCTLDA